MVINIVNNCDIKSVVYPLLQLLASQGSVCILSDSTDFNYIRTDNSTGESKNNINAIDFDLVSNHLLRDSDSMLEVQSLEHYDYVILDNKSGFIDTQDVKGVINFIVVTRFIGEGFAKTVDKHIKDPNKYLVDIQAVSAGAYALLCIDCKMSRSAVRLDSISFSEIVELEVTGKFPVIKSEYKRFIKDFGIKVMGLKNIDVRNALSAKSVLSRGGYREVKK